MKTMFIDYNAEENKIFLRYPFDRDMNDYLFQEKFFAFWSGEDMRREITIKEEYIEGTLRNMCKLIRAWKGVYEFNVTAEYRIFLNEEAAKIKVEEGKSEERKKKSRKTKSSIKIPIPKGLKLLPFQKAGVEYIESVDGKALVADEMGLGKTVQAIAYLNKVKAFPTLIVCPATLKLNWRDECKKWLVGKKTIQVVNSKDGIESGSDIVIINYDIVKKFYKELEDYNFQSIILDEAHFVKNYKSDRTKLVRTLARKIPIRLALTGTPIINRPMEVYTITNIINPKVFNWKQFTDRYCLFGEITDFRHGASNLHELQQKLRESIMVRRLKKDVLKELPAKRRILIPLEGKKLTGQRVLLREKADKMKLRKNRKGDKLDDFESTKLGMIHEIEKMKQDAAKAKMPMAIKFIDNLIDEQGKVVVFAHHKNIVEEIKNTFGEEAVMIYGETKMEDRDDAVKRFQSDPKIKVFIGSMRACGFGLTLTAASNVVFLEFDWTPAIHNQSEDRCHRIGQKDSVNVYYLALENSIDIFIAKLLQEKQEVIDQILDDEEEKELIGKVNIFDDLIEII